VRTAAAAVILTLSGSPAVALAAQAPPPPTQTLPTQTPPPTQPPPSSATQTGSGRAIPPEQSGTSQTPVPTPDLDRIKNALTREPRLKIDDGQMRIYVEIIGKWPRFDQIVGDYDLKNGPTRRGAVMTHNEFLAMVTPKEMYSTAGIKPTEMLQFALVNALGQALIKKALEEIRNARTEREIQTIRERIDRELAALRGGGDR